MILPDLPVRIGPGGVEISKRRPSNPGRLLEVRQGTLDGQLGLAVTVDRPLRMRFCDGGLHRLTVGRAGGREHEGGHLLGRHGFEHAERPDDIVAVVLRRLAHRLAHVQKCRKVHDRRDPMRPERTAHRRHVRDVTLDQLAVPHRRPMPGDEVVVDDDMVARPAEGFAGVAADVPRPAGHEHASSRAVARHLSGQWRSRRSRARACARASRCCGRRTPRAP